MNVGNFDRIVRVVLGLALIFAPLLAGWPTLAVVTGVLVGLVLVGTAAFAFCPIYALLGVSSNRRRAQSGN